ncbi:uncharacterized protein ARMOST_03839 [Armillaria ostoyae]|uniref:Uncharacterized protein n=1 Tax=Armillaria ostoyae TaxID=47428 RepID=A0A284QVN9_ARMOS|nr:uncharacterized protein ARMOST_03839 [Armillaria ostoyae]
MSASSHTVNERSQNQDRSANGVEEVARHDNVVPPMAEEEAAHGEVDDPFTAKLERGNTTPMSIPMKDFLMAILDDLITIDEMPDKEASLILETNFKQYLLGMLATAKHELT